MRRLDVTPPLADDELAAVVRALAQAGVRLDGAPDAYASAWRRAALDEAVDGAQPDADGSYAPSPRSTRGATRA